ncbi:MAG TPA: cell division protein [Caulobacteraceae bacterium]|jgi:hypothetical protein
MKLSGVLGQRVRGFRVVDLVALVIFLALALTVYAFKTSAGRERTDISHVESQIHDETRQVKLLRAQLAHLESPDRLEKLATQYAGQAPVGAKQELTPEALAQVVRPIPAPAPPAAKPGGQP